MLYKLMREPLIHFLLAGFLLFLYCKSCSSATGVDDEIEVTQESLLSYMQYQSKAFNPDVFQEKFEQFSASEKEEMVQNYLRDEALYREAIAIGLDQNDFVIKRRIIQKMEFILDDFDVSDVEIEADSLEAFYDSNEQRYFRPKLYTFTHVYFNSAGDTRARAAGFLIQHGSQGMSASESLPYGDRFLYHRTYAEKTADFLEGHFGSGFVQALDGLLPDEERWQGPIESDHGTHLVHLSQRDPASVPELDEIRSVVEADYLSHLRRQHQQRKIQKIVDRYKVVEDL